MNTPIQIQQRIIGAGQRPFVVAELSANHNQSLDVALRLVDAAADAGVDAIKLQTYTADAMTLDSDAPAFVVNQVGQLWEGEKLYDLYHKAHTPWDWHKALFDRCKEKNLICFSTPFDDASVDFLESLEAPLYKIASFELTHHPLLKKVARTGKPVVMSTGMATEQEIAEAVQCLRDAGCQSLILLKCTSAYPAEYADANLLSMPALAERFDCLSGLSDHTLGISVPLAATALGACFIEKHITLDRNDGGVDSAFSLEPAEFTELMQGVTQAYAALGQVQFQPSENELGARKYRRSLYARCDIKAGDVFTDKNVAVVRPSGGLPPSQYEIVLGQRAHCDIAFAEPIQQQHLGGQPLPKMANA